MGASNSKSSSPSSSAKTGGEWKGQVYFNPNSEVSGKKDFIIDDEKLKDEMEKIIDNEPIKKIWVYKKKLFGWQRTQLIFNHQFVVLETCGWWWSIEKNSEGITIQRSKYLQYVKDCYRGEKRQKPIEEVISGRSEKKMKDVVDFLYQNDELNKKYNLYTRNCQHFAQTLFKEFSNEFSNEFSELSMSSIVTKILDSCQILEYSALEKCYLSFRGPLPVCFIEFITHSNPPSEKQYQSMNEKLRDNMREVTEDGEGILTTWIYSFSSCTFVVVIKTSAGSWSIEKNINKITIQRGKKVAWVRDYFMGRKRPTSMREIARDKGRIKMRELVEFLCRNDELKNMTSVRLAEAIVKTSTMKTIRLNSIAQFTEQCTGIAQGTVSAPAGGPTVV